MEQERILCTGGSGLLGRELRRLLPRALYPDHREFDVTNAAQMDSYLAGRGVELLIHAAAFTSPPKVDQDPPRAIEVNIIGTSRVVRLCMQHGIRLVYISTDYVFRGDRGGYREDDPVFPVNRYAWSKLGGECAVRLYDRALIVRTSFGANEFPYPRAFVDQWTSRLTVRDFAVKLVALLNLPMTGIVHIGGPRRTVYDYARATSPGKEIGELSRDDVPFAAPRDTSLDTSNYERIVEESDPGR